MSFVLIPGGGEFNALVAPAGTRIPFNQGTAPPGWVVDSNTALNDCSMRVNGVTGGSTGGSTTWSSWNFGGVFDVNAFALSTAQLPAHNHGISDPGHAHVYSDPGHSHLVGGTFAVSGTTISQEGTNTRLFNLVNNPPTNLSGTNITILATLTNVSTTNTGSGSAIAPTYTTPQVKFTDFLIGVKA